MTALQKKLNDSGQSLTQIANAIGVSLQDLSHFVHEEWNRIGRDRKKLIRHWMIDHGYIRARKARPFYKCPTCGARRFRKLERLGNAESSMMKEKNFDEEHTNISDR